MDNQEVRKLWGMSVRDFNDWRRQNDLPDLLRYIQKVLPHFAEWQTTFGIDDSAFLSSDRPSMFFRGSGDRYLQRVRGPGRDGKIETGMSFGDLLPEQARERQRKMWNAELWTIEDSKPFRPFFDWLKSTKGVKWLARA